MVCSQNEQCYHGKACNRHVCQCKTKSESLLWGGVFTGDPPWDPGIQQSCMKGLKKFHLVYHFIYIPIFYFVN